MSQDTTAHTPEIITLASREIYANRWMRLREDSIRRADGQEGIYSVVEKPDFAVIAAVQDGQIYLVEQYRYPVSGRHWELPQGTWDKDESDPLGLARAELQEETGLQAGQMQWVGHLYLAYGFCTQAYDLFLATDLRQGPQALEPEEQGLICRPFAIETVLEQVRGGQLQDATTVAALGLLRLKGLI